MSIRVGRKLILEHNTIYEMFSDSLFWEKVPEFLYMKEDGERAHHFVIERFLHPKETFPGCANCSNTKKILQPILDEMTSKITEWADTSPDKLKNLIAYITKRRGYRPNPISIYCKDSVGKIYTVEF